MRKYYERTYYTLDDVANDLVLAGAGAFRMAETTKHRAVEMPDFINRVLEKVSYDTLDMSALISNKYLTEVWTKYIYPKFYNQFVCYYDKAYCYQESNDTDLTAAAAFADYLGTIISWMFSSTEKFSLTIANLEANKDNLLQQIKTSSISRFNDTPQNQGAFEDDAHNTTVTKNEGSTDGGTLLSRLNEVEDSMKRLYNDWSNEFRQFIIWSVND